MDIDKMEAGDALDALVADRVMGWIWWVNVKSNRRGLFPPEATGVGHDGSWRRADGSEEPFVGRVGLIPSYSVEIDAAWLVVEALKADSWEGSVQVSGAAYKARFHFSGAEALQRSAFSTEAATPPLAICRAALKVAALKAKGAGDA